MSDEKSSYEAQNILGEMRNQYCNSLPRRAHVQQGLRDWSWCPYVGRYKLYLQASNFQKKTSLQIPQKSLLNPVEYATVTLLSATINCQWVSMSKQSIVAVEKTLDS